MRRAFRGGEIALAPAPGTGPQEQPSIECAPLARIAQLLAGRAKLAAATPLTPELMAFMGKAMASLPPA